MNKLAIILQLSKVKITFAVSLTTITGYVLGQGSFNIGWVGVTLGIFLLACGASVLNHIQEARTDARMERTYNRPLPKGEISMAGAALLAIGQIALGSFILGYWVNLEALLLGWLALLWYNVIYTYLKRVTPHAVIPGSVIGAIPPVAGWVASGASLAHPSVAIIALFFFVWQVPHFYLLVIRFGSDYQRAGFPALTGMYTEYIIRIFILLWIVTTAGVAITLYFFGVVQSLVSFGVILLVSLWLIAIFSLPVIQRQRSYPPFHYFMRINYFVLVIIIILNLDHVLLNYLNV